MNPSTVTHRGSSNSVLWIGLLTILVTSGVRADDGVAYFDVALTEACGIEEFPTPHADWRTVGEGATLAHVILDPPAEAYLASDENGRFGFESFRLVARVDGGHDLRGEVVLPTRMGYGRYAVHIAAANASSEHERAFHRAKLSYYTELRRRPGAGAAWFRHRADEARRALGDVSPSTLRDWAVEQELQTSYHFLTGGRALAENLQLDRALSVSDAGEETVTIASLNGVEVRPFDWAPLIEGLAPDGDRLADVVPFDQHAIFFPSYRAFDRLCDEGHRFGDLLAGLVESHSGDTRVIDRYERQLGLSRDILSRLFGDRVIASMALTGSDPYLRTGSDLAVLFEPREPAALVTFLTTKLARVASEVGANVVPGTLGEGEAALS
ncbi:MAG: hypothetical protein KDC38_08170, partial [Planctomycetes bacterium]|nr:hypothetical protein [Planctomycetota bacterium]